MLINIGLFEKNFDKILNVTVDKFGSIDLLEHFLEEISICGSVTKAAENANIKISPLYLQRIINNDRYLSKCVFMSKFIATERAEAVLYERAINGYKEITYGRDGQPIQIKRKYCPKSLMEYLKANSEKYSLNGNRNRCNNSCEDNNAMDDNVNYIEVESYKSYEDD